MSDAVGKSVSTSASRALLERLEDRGELLAALAMRVTRTMQVCIIDKPHWSGSLLNLSVGKGRRFKRTQDEKCKSLRDPGSTMKCAF